MTSAYTRPEDVERAEKQLAYASLAAEERAAQDEWADGKGKDLAPCPNNLSWRRDDTHQGYRCSGGVSSGALAPVSLFYLARCPSLNPQQRMMTCVCM